MNLIVLVDMLRRYNPPILILVETKAPSSRDQRFLVVTI